MAMNKVPSLIIGVGGIGCQIAAGVSELLSEEDRKYVGIVGIDTNVNDLAQLRNKRIRTIQTSDNRLVRDYLVQHPEYTAWFPVSRFVVDRGMLDGAGQIRAISRLAAIAAEESGMFTPIDEEIKRIRAIDGEAGRRNLTVMVVGSITGGTGAGIFLQIPYYIRKLMKHTDGMDAIIIRGMFVSSDITAPVQPSRINQKAMCVNAYACLKELNAFYRTQTDAQQERKLELEWFEKRSEEDRDIIARKIKENQRRLGDDFIDEDDAAVLYGGETTATDRRILSEGNANIPYNYLYLIEGSNDQGGIGQASIGSVINQISRIVFTYMFTPVKDNALSVEDNFVLQDMAEGGMNRYASAGLCRLVYPKELVQQYVTLRAARDLVKGEWLLIDRRIQEEIVIAMAQMRNDPTVEKPKVETAYPKYFAEEVAGEKGNLARLFKQAYVEAQDHTISLRADGFFQKIEEQVDAVLESEEVKAAANACKAKADRMRTVKDAKGEVEKVYEALDKFEKLAKKLVSSSSARIANDVFPPSWDGMMGAKGKEQCIYGLLSSVHPIVGRAFCYHLINRLTSSVTELTSDEEAIDLDAYENVDFDPKEGKVQKPGEALEKMGRKTGWRSVLAKAGLNLDAGNLSRLESKLNKDVCRAQSSMIKDYLETKLKLNVYRELLRRLEKLAENYAVFFSGIEDMIKENEERIERIEASEELPLGQKGIYCDSEALHTIYEEYKRTGSDELPDETYKEVFEQLFRVFADDFSLSDKALSDSTRKRHNAERQTALRNIFDQAVIKTLSHDVERRGENVIDMTVLQALARQMELKTAVTKNNENYEEEVRVYVRERIEEALRMSSPMLAVNRGSMASNTETVYVALNPRCAVFRENKPDANATKEKYIQDRSEASDGMPITLLMDEEFPPYEITCLKARYKFLIDDLIKYGPSSKNAEAYRERIANLGKSPTDVSDPDSYKTVVNPHLNRFWHEEAFLPEISPVEHQKEREDCVKAFIYGLGFDLFVRREDEDVIDSAGKPRRVWLSVLTMDGRPIKSCGKMIGNEFYDLFEAIPYNGRLKKAVLSYARRQLKRLKGYRESAELFETILDDEFIKDLCQPSTDMGISAEMNIFDIFLKMRDKMASSEWSRLFTGLLHTLWDYCSVLFDGNERMVNQATRQILQKIYEGCSAAKKREENQPLSSGEQRITEQYDSLLQKTFQL